MAVLDSCVLFAEMTRNLLLHIAGAGLYRARWTDDIHNEWISAVEQKLSIPRERLERLKMHMNTAIQDCLVTDYQPLIDNLTLPDPNDRHILAAAITCGAHVIITTNLKDFPKEELSLFNLAVQHPDDFIVAQLGLSSSSTYRVAISVVRHKKSLTKSKPTWKQYLERLSSSEVGLPRTFQAVSEAEFRLLIAQVLRTGDWLPP